MALEKAGHWAIRVGKVRAVIDQPFKHARMPEALLTCRGMDPIYVPVEELEAYLKARRNPAGTSTEILYAEVKNIARKWAKQRRPVRHRIWKEPEK